MVLSYVVRMRDQTFNKMVSKGWFFQCTLCVSINSCWDRIIGLSEDMVTKYSVEIFGRFGIVTKFHLCCRLSSIQKQQDLREILISHLKNYQIGSEKVSKANWNLEPPHVHHVQSLSTLTTNPTTHHEPVRCFQLLTVA